MKVTFNIGSFNRDGVEALFAVIFRNRKVCHFKLCVFTGLRIICPASFIIQM